MKKACRFRHIGDAVVLEGDNPADLADLRVFVADPPAAGEQLFVRRVHDRSGRGAAAEALTASKVLEDHRCD